MKNKKGFTIIELLTVLIILGIILTIAVPTVSRQIEKARENTYKSHEKALEDAAKRFITKCIVKNKCDDEKTVDYYTSDTGYVLKYQTLKDNEYIDELKDPKTNNECTGYVILTSVNTYTTVLICKNTEYTYISKDNNGTSLITNGKLNDIYSKLSSTEATDGILISDTK